MCRRALGRSRNLYARLMPAPHPTHQPCHTIRSTTDKAEAPTRRSASRFSPTAEHDTIWPVRAFACPVCNDFAAFESMRCATCHTALGFHLPTRSMLPVADGVALVGERQWVRCTQSETLGCNWLAPEEQSPFE